MFPTNGYADCKRIRNGTPEHRARTARCSPGRCPTEKLHLDNWHPKLLSAAVGALIGFALIEVVPAVSLKRRTIFRDERLGASEPSEDRELLL